MGYWYEISCETFETTKTLDQCRQLREDILERVPCGFPFENKSIIANAELTCLTTEDNINFVAFYLRQPQQKWGDEADSSFAAYVSLLIKDGTSTTITCVGSDGEIWGFNIMPMKIVKTKCVFVDTPEITVLTKSDIVTALI